MNDKFRGFTYNLLSREYEWFTTPPSTITPFQLMKWALACGSWSIEDDPNTGCLAFVGPPGPTPWVTSSMCTYTDDSIALQIMRAHYTHWWGQRESVKKAFELLSAQVPDSNKSPGKDFNIPDDSDNDFKGTEED